MFNPHNGEFGLSAFLQWITDPSTPDALPTWDIAYQKLVQCGPLTLRALFPLSCNAIFVFTVGVTAERVIVFIGAPGSGKGTQAARLSKQLGIAALSTGEMLRGEAKRETAEGRRLRAILAAGSLVDDTVVCAAINARLHRELPARGIILDGFPRNLNQARRLDRILREMGQPGPLVLHIQVSRACLMKRLTLRRYCGVCGTVYNLALRPSQLGANCENDGALLLSRDDDKESVIARRLQEFDSAVAPLIDYYRRADYHLIDGDQDAEIVADGLMTIVGIPKTAAAA
jgi:adenylate kinase